MTKYEIISTIILLVSFAANVFQFRSRKPKLKIQLCRSHEVNMDGIGTYLCARILISNHGSETAYYSGLQAIDGKGELFFPSCNLGIPSEIPPNASIVGTIPNGHLLCDGTKELLVVDGTLQKHKVAKRHLKTVIQDLKVERQRLENLGYEVHPNRSWATEKQA
ncbi:peptidase T [Vibrio cholerae]|uniref:peptidase T n=1 Tax=Vibrio cholerae TaxID=666 RepID=UPI000BA95A8E|nr:peptidase T [Vibrio cholerae]EGR0144027.1 peptidase T [Vibrio cholerae]EKF9814110.1 peptidase T [Vibrio cholerae]ELL1566664.1 peptidase T [Vibrio cholerae]PAS36294.1 peptidase T [Vibrio cholerae]PAS37334.1 peptidase T [Vibrio cholerae]